jgi:YVTN family beta-propeller protein
MTAQPAPSPRKLSFLIALFLLCVLGIPFIARAAQSPPDAGPENVSAIDTATNTVVKTITVGELPDEVALTPNGKTAYIPNLNSGDVSAIDTDTNTVVKTIPVGGSPEAIAITPDGKTVYVGNRGSGSVSAIDTTTNTVAETITVGMAPVAIAITPTLDGKTAYVANRGSDNVSAIDTDTNTVAETIPVGVEPIAIAITPDGTAAYVANPGSGSVSAIDTATNSVMKTVTVGTEPRAIAITLDGKTAYVANLNSETVSAIDTATSTVAKTITVGRSPGAIAITPDSETAYVANARSENVSVITTADNTVAKTVTVGKFAEDIAITPDGKTAYVANEGLTITDKPPLAAFQANAARIRPGVPLNLDASASKDPDSPIANYAWSFGDGQSQSITTPQATHTFNNLGTYTISVKETDAEGCSNTPQTFLVPGKKTICEGNGGAQVSKQLTVSYPGVSVKCPKSAGPKGCAFKLQAVPRKPKRGKKPLFQSALAKAKVKAGGSAIVSLIPKAPFNATLAAAQSILVKETVLAKGKSKTHFVKLAVAS